MEQFRESRQGGTLQAETSVKAKTRILVKGQPRHENREAERSLTLEPSSLPQERYFPPITIPTLKHNAAQVTLTIKLYRKFHFFLFLLRLGGRCNGRRRGTKLDVRKLLAIKVNSRNFVPNLHFIKCLTCE